MAARQHLDAARPVARLLVERRPRLVESKYAMGQQTNSEVLSPSQSLDIPDLSMTGSSDEDGYENDDKSEKKEHDDEDEESQVGFTSFTPLQIKFILLLICQCVQVPYLSNQTVYHMVQCTIRL